MLTRRRGSRHRVRLRRDGAEHRDRCPVGETLLAEDDDLLALCETVQDLDPVGLAEAELDLTAVGGGAAADVHRVADRIQHQRGLGNHQGVLVTARSRA